MEIIFWACGPADVVDLLEEVTPLTTQINFLLTNLQSKFLPADVAVLLRVWHFDPDLTSAADAAGIAEIPSAQISATAVNDLAILESCHLDEILRLF